MSFFFVQIRWKSPVSGNGIIWQRGVEKHLVETGHTRSVISFYQGFWKAVVSISHHCHISCPLSMGFLKKSENICERKISTGRIRAEVFYLLSAFWTPKRMPLSTDLEAGRVGPQTICSGSLRWVSGSQPPRWLCTLSVRWGWESQEVAQGTGVPPTSKNHHASQCLMKV